MSPAIPRIFSETSFLMANLEENRYHDVLNLSAPDIKLKTWFPDNEVNVLSFKTAVNACTVQVRIKRA